MSMAEIPSVDTIIESFTTSQDAVGAAKVQAETSVQTAQNNELAAYRQANIDLIEASSDPDIPARKLAEAALTLLQFTPPHTLRGPVPSIEKLWQSSMRSNQMSL